ncbi:MAG: hypothetical protein [Olavius algarvensis Gamma 3 endosymbiont]|nr:MAG: hypothetical protein [Olavius algarvensis Gamma 3 endosymbiont]
MPPSNCIELNASEQSQLLALARQSIQSGLESGRALRPDLARYEDKLQIDRAVFITLTQDGELRGCVGSLQAVEPLAQAVATAAYNAAFRDRRFAALSADELKRVRIEISVLSELQPIEAQSRQALLDLLQPGVDGLLLEDRGYRSTFLPKIWEKIVSPGDFLEQLLLKAGLGADYWSDSLRFQRYQSLNITEI